MKESAMKYAGFLTIRIRRIIYDLVLSNLVLHYIEDLEQVYRDVYRTLKRGGCFLFNIEHPVFTAGIHQDWIYDENGEIQYWAIDDYYYPGKRETNFLGQKVIKQHHTLTQILNLLFAERIPSGSSRRCRPGGTHDASSGMKDEMRRPMMLLVKAVK